MLLFIGKEEKKYFDYSQYILWKEKNIEYILWKLNFNVNDTDNFSINWISVKKRSYEFIKNLINKKIIWEKISFTPITKMFLKTRDIQYLDNNCLLVLEWIIWKTQVNFIISQLKNQTFLNQIFFLLELQIKIKWILTTTKLEEIYIAYIYDLVKYYKEKNLIVWDINSDKKELDNFKNYILSTIWIDTDDKIKSSINLLKQTIKFELILNYENEFDGIKDILPYLNESDKKELEVYYIIKSDSTSYRILELIPNLDNYINNIDDFILNLNKLWLFKVNYDWYKNTEVLNYLVENINFCWDFTIFLKNSLLKIWTDIYDIFSKNLNFITYITDMKECEILNILTYKNSINILTKNYYRSEIQNLLWFLSAFKITFHQNNVLKYLIDNDEYFKNKYNNLQKSGTRRINADELLYIVWKSINEDLVLKWVNISLDNKYPHLKWLLPYQLDWYKKAKEWLVNYNWYIIADDVWLWKTFVWVWVIWDYLIELPKWKKILLISTKSVIDWKAWFYALKSSWFNEKLIEEKIIFTTNIWFDKYVDDPSLWLVVIDEAHFFRNKWTGRFEEISKLIKYDIVDEKIVYKRKVPVFMLTATPINNSMEDLYNLVSIFYPEITIWYNKKLLEDKYFIEKLKLFINKYNRKKIVATFWAITINWAEIKDEQPVIKYIQTNEEWEYKEHLINFINETFTYGFKENMENIFSISKEKMERDFSTGSILKVLWINWIDDVKRKLGDWINIPLENVKSLWKYDDLLTYSLNYIENKFNSVVSQKWFNTYLYLNSKKDDELIQSNEFILSKLNEIDGVLHKYLSFIEEEFIEKPKLFIYEKTILIDEWKKARRNSTDINIIDYIKKQDFTYDFLKNYNSSWEVLNEKAFINHYNRIVENFIIEDWIIDEWSILKEKWTKTEIKEVIDGIYDLSELKKDLKMLFDFQEKWRKEQTQKWIFNWFLGALVLKRFDSSPYSLIQTLKKLAYKNDNLDLEEDNSQEIKESINSLTQDDRDYIKSIVDKYEDIILERDFKYERLKELIMKEKDKQWLIFTSYTDTLLDLEWKIKKDFWENLNIETIKWSDNSKVRLWIIRRFAPGVNKYTMTPEDKKIDILIATDSIAEWVNLHDVYRGINYDLPYNPVKLQQRVGRLFRVWAKHTPLFYNFVPSTLMDNMLWLMKIIWKKENIIKTFFWEKRAKDDNIEQFLSEKINSNSDEDYNNLIEENKKADIFISDDNNFSELQEFKIKELIEKYWVTSFTFWDKKILYNTSFWWWLNKTFIIPVLNGKIYNNIAIEFKWEEKERVFDLIWDNFINYINEIKNGNSIQDISIILKILFSIKIDNLINDTEIKELSNNTNIVNNFIPKQKYELIFKQLIDINKPLENEIKDLYYLVLVL